ncbi:glycosyltransferase [Halobacillus sp. K22]|uniref:glycosyltransferase n=1 Tax=Halobacillus sp. K22 TaxID=3457431 RepID=UPI003FCCADEE
MKKNLLFVIDSLNCAGAEKSLVTLLSLLDYDKYNVDLLLFGYGGSLEKIIPREVNLLPPLRYTDFSSLSFRKAINTSLQNSEYNMMYARLKYSFLVRKKKSLRNVVKARMYWESVSRVIDERKKEYDTAIAYAQGVPTFYVAEKVKARQKLAWVNISYRMEEKDKEFQTEYYDKFDKIVAVSETTEKVFKETFPNYSYSIKVIYDINNEKLITKMAEEEQPYKNDSQPLRILTIGRLDYQKGYDIALEACEKLKQRGVNFKWYVLGKGPLQRDIVKAINDKGLGDYFILLGVKANPYPYVKNSDIYVQTSKFEGFGLAIAEARMLNVPVVTTRFDAVYNQMIHGKNGLVVDMDGHSIYEGVMKLIENPSLRKQIIEYLKEEKKGNTEELEKFYDLIS